MSYLVRLRIRLGSQHKNKGDYLNVEESFKIWLIEVVVMYIYSGCFIKTDLQTYPQLIPVGGAADMICSHLYQANWPMIQKTRPRGMVNLVIRPPNIRISNPHYSTFRRALYSRSRKQHQTLGFRADVQLRVDARILRCRKSNFDNGIVAPHVTDFDISWAVPLTTMGFPSRGHSHHLFIYSSNANWSSEITSRTCFFLHVCHHHMRSAFKGTRKRCVSHCSIDHFLAPLLRILVQSCVPDIPQVHPYG